MPLYTYRCSCGAETDAFNSVAERRTSAPECHGPMEIKLCPNLGYVQRECNYRCPVTGQEVTNNRQRRRIMDSNGLVDANDFPPGPAIAKAEKERADNAELGAKLVNPLSDRQMQEFVPKVSI